MALQDQRTAVERQAPAAAASAFAAAFDDFPGPSEVLRVIRRHKLLMVLVILPLTMLAGAYGLLAPDRYRATSIVALVPKDPALANLGATPGQLVRDMPVLETQIRVILSPAVLGDVVDRLDLLNNPDFIRPLSVRSQLVDLVKTAMESYRLTDKIREAKESLGLDFGADRKPLSRNDMIRSLAEDLDVEQAGQSYAITISFTGPNPDLGASIVNEVAQSYVRRQLADKLAATGGAAAYLTTRLSELRKEVEQADRSLEQYRVSNQLPVDGNEELLSKRVNDLTTELIGVRSEIAVTESRVRSLETLQSNPDPSQLARALDSSTAQALQLEEVALERRRAELLASYGERHPLVQALRADQAALRRKIRNEAELSLADVRRGLDLLRVKETELARAIADAEATITSDQRALVQGANLKRDADVNRRLYEELLTQQKLLTERQSLIQPDMQVIAEASSDIRNSAPPLVFYPVIGFIGSCGLATLLALIRDRSDPRVRSAAQLERLTGLRVLGRLSTVRQLRSIPAPRFVGANPRSAYTESLRHIYHALEHQRQGRDAMVVMLTSTSAGEGKSTTVAGLAGLLRHSGRRVAVIDLDLRRPRLNQLFELDAQATTINALLLANRDEWVRSVYALTPQPFAVIPAHVTYDDVLPLLDSRQMGATIRALRLSFDYVLIDTPPVLPTSDACSLARHADTTILVCRWLRTEIAAVREAVDRLTAPRLAPVFGVVLNMVDPVAYGSYAPSYGERAPLTTSYP